MELEDIEINNLMLDNDPNAIIVFNDSFQVVGGNRDALKRFGFSCQEEFTEGFVDELKRCIPPCQPSGRESIPLSQRLIFAAGNGFHEFNTELIIKGKAALYHVTFKRVAYGDSFFILAYMTEKHEMDERGRLMLDATPLACAILYEGSYSIKDCNIVAVRLFGFLSKEEFIERYLEMIPDELPDGTHSRSFLTSKIDEAYKNGKSVFNFVFRTMEGAELPVELTAVRIVNHDKYACSIYARDLRELKETEDKLYLHANLLKAVNRVATILIEAETDAFDTAISKTLEIIGRAAEVDRVYIWENFKNNGKLFCRQIYEWSENVEPQQGKDFTVSFDYDRLPLWKSHILNNKPINGPVKSQPESVREILEAQGIKSILVLPLNLRGEVWGFIGFDDCNNEQTFSKARKQVLQSCGILVVSSIERNKARARLLDTTNELQAHERLLRAVNEVANILLEAEHDDFYRTLRQALSILGQCASSHHVAIWRNYTDNGGRLCCVRQSSWMSNRLIEEEMERISIDYETHLPEVLAYRSDINGPLSILSEKLRNLIKLTAESCKSLLLLPINIHGEFWGFISFFHHEEEYLFTTPEKNILRAGGMMIASAMIRDEITESLVDAREKALLSAKSKSEFLSRMSHEIRTPMNAIIGMTQLAKKSDDLQKIRHCLNTVDDSSRRLLDIINDVLDMSKIDANKLELHQNEFEFEDILRHVFNVTQIKLDEKKIDFRLDFKRAFSRKIISDDLRLSQVLINLISNAVKFTPAYGTITLRVSENPVDNNHSMLIMEVIDNGIGVSEERIGSIFQSFEQGDGGITREYGGSGLGLAICKRIVDMMGGEIKVESELNRGSKFTVTVKVEWGGESGGTHSLGLKKNLRVLVVDDDPDSVEYLKSVLSSLSIDCDTAGNGYEALGRISEKIMEENPYDVVLLDWYMPGLDGGETLLEMRRLLGEGDVIVIMVSGADLDVIENEPGASDMRYFLSKPVLCSDLYNVLLRLTGNPAPLKNPMRNEEWDASSYNWSEKRILLVDDNDINREIVDGILEGTGVDIVSAVNGREAVEVFSGMPDKFDVILMDIQMPVLDGLSATREIRALGGSGSDVPIIAMTANAFKEDAEASYEAGMNGHIAKPFEMSEIFNTLKKYL